MYKSTGDVAKIYGVHISTVQRWVKDGILKNVKKTPGGHFRIWLDGTEMDPPSDDQDKTETEKGK